ncbi:MAG: hypothetical protein DID92_2727744100 [Candidatus Nitrotoga sp. SPKER]|nr:MAG: hypothetical protein DID92_2727744100 [Candidatus Nitrotoga sp. SPKER]
MEGDFDATTDEQHTASFRGKPAVRLTARHKVIITAAAQESIFS